MRKIPLLKLFHGQTIKVSSFFLFLRMNYYYEEDFYNLVELNAHFFCLGNGSKMHSSKSKCKVIQWKGYMVVAAASYDVALLFTHDHEPATSNFKKLS